MKTNLIIMCLCFFMSLSAQKDGIQVAQQDYVIKNLLCDKPDLMGKAYIFPYRVFNFSVDKASNLLFVQLRKEKKNGEYYTNKGEILQYDLVSGNTLWQEKMSYMFSEVMHEDSLILMSDDKSTRKIDASSGLEAWKTNIRIRNISSGNIGFGYDEGLSFTGQRSNMLTGINLTSGEIQWKRKVRFDYGWTDMRYPDDSTLLLVAGDLQCINLNNGEGWEYKTTTAKKDYKQSIGINALGLAAGLLTGTALIYTGNDLLTDLKSNILTNDSVIYFASTEAIAKLDRNTGNPVWSYPFEKKEASRSSIFLRGDTLYMVNMGAGIMSENIVPYGKSFMAAFNASTGEKLYCSLFSDEKKDVINSCMLAGDSVFMIRDNKLCIASIRNGEIEKEVAFEQDSIGELNLFIRGNVFKSAGKESNRMIPLTQSENEVLFIHTTNNYILGVDKYANIVRIYRGSELATLYAKTDKYRIISFGHDYMLMDNEGEVSTLFTAPYRLKVIDNTLYGIDGNRIFKIDLES